MKRGNFSSLSRLALIAVTFATAGSAHAVNCITSPNSTECINSNTSNVPGTVVVTQGVLQNEANQLTNIIENRLKQIRGTPAIMAPGYSAGDQLTGFATWANVGWDHLNNDLSSTAYSGHITTTTAGFDTIIEGIGIDAVAGLAISWENQNLVTGFNLGTQEADGWAVIPYVAFMFCDNWSLMLLGGYEWLDYDLNRLDPLDSSLIVGEPKSNRTFAALELIYQQYFCDIWDLSAQAAVLYLNEDTGGFTEVQPHTSGIFNQGVDYYLGRFKLGATFGYLYNDLIEPYVRAALLWDFSQSDVLVAPIQPFPSNSDTAGLFGVGLNIFSTDCVMFNVDFYTEQFRDDFERWGFMANFRVAL
jgi:outer membrane autotransporter protein